MESFVEKFNIFDLFTMLIPGIIISTLFGVSMSFKYYNTWTSFGNEKYIVFFIFSYLCGVIYQELGTMADNLFLNKILYGGKPREIFLLEDKHKKVLNNEFLYEDAIKIKNYIVNIIKIKYEDNIDNKQKKKLNSLIFSYCLNLLEKNKMTYKSDKMLVISEMSRSLFWGCISTTILNIFMIFRYSFHYKFYFIEIIFLVIFALIFLYRKVRYEKYRLHILLRTFMLYIKVK